MRLLRTFADSLMMLLASLPPGWSEVLRCVAYPLLEWHMRDIVNVLKNHYRFEKPIHWSNIPKHEQSLVWNKYRGMDSKLRILGGVWVVDFRHKTIRIVLGMPERLKRTGVSF